jgi:hypothetical protein
MTMIYKRDDHYQYVCDVCGERGRWQILPEDSEDMEELHMHKQHDGSYDPEPDIDNDDEILAGAGWGTDEDYGYYGGA